MLHFNGGKANCIHIWASLTPLSAPRFAEPEKKRSKLVLPAPQISDAELEEVVKVRCNSNPGHRSPFGSMLAPTHSTLTSTKSMLAHSAHAPLPTPCSAPVRSTLTPIRHLLPNPCSPCPLEAYPYPLHACPYTYAPLLHALDSPPAHRYHLFFHYYRSIFLLLTVTIRIQISW